MGQLRSLCRLSTILKLTTATHTILAAGVFVHSRLTDRNASRWIVFTLLFGLFGVAGYLLDD